MRRTAAGVAAVLLSLLVIVILSGAWPSPIAADLSLALPPPGELWIVLVLLVAQAVVSYLYFRERSRLRRALGGGRVELAEPEPELRPHGPMAGEPPAPSGVASEEISDARMAAVAAAESKPDGEFSKLLQWLDDVSSQISGWAKDVMGPDATAHPDDAHASTPLVLEDAKPRGTSKVPVPTLGAWTEVRARTAIEKVLRKRPWAPAADIAKKLGMDLRLASRVASSLREESVR
jgi:hypothetical protein